MTVLTLCNHGRFSYLSFSKTLNESDKILVKNALLLTDMWKKRDKFLKEISGGELQRAYLAMVIAQNTKTILLDEPASFMDIKHQLSVLNVLKKLANEGRGIVIVSHDIPQSFTFSDEIFLIKNGQIVKKGNPNEVANDYALLKDVVGVCLEKNKGQNLLYDFSLSK